MKLNHANYYSAEADREYMSNSQLKGWLECPRRQWAKLNGQWDDEEPMAFLVGKYVDQWLLTPGTATEFCDANKDALFTKAGKPRAEIELADRMVARAERDDLFMGSLAGETQKLITWEMLGIKWRALIDVVDPDRGILCDLKTVRDFDEQWDPVRKMKLPFYERYGYWQQLAIYREAYRAEFGKHPELVVIAAVSKQWHPRLKVIQFDGRASLAGDADLDGSCRFERELEKVQQVIRGVMEHKAASKAEDVPGCGACDYCADQGEAKMEAAASLCW